jgi:Kdo2-lipid IVA lauroyltransferase/acyltransferase
MLLFLLKLIAQLPLSVLRALGSALGWLAYHLSSKTRHTVAQNLAQAQQSISPQTATQNNMRGLFDMLWVWFTPASTVAHRCEVVDASMHTALNGAQATILLTPHLGCFEALAKWIATQTPLTAMYRRPDKPWLAALVETARNTPNLTMAPADAGGVRLALKTLKAGGTLGILPDQVPRRGEGVWLPWFGREAYTITLPAKLQQAMQARVFIVAALPTAAGWGMVCEPVTIKPDLNAEQLSAQLNLALERMVLRAPQDYAWTYKRYTHIQ